jgi:hypothetical protein
MGSGTNEKEMRYLRRKSAPKKSTNVKRTTPDPVEYIAIAILVGFAATCVFSFGSGDGDGGRKDVSDDVADEELVEEEEELVEECPPPPSSEVVTYASADVARSVASSFSARIVCINCKKKQQQHMHRIGKRNIFFYYPSKKSTATPNNTVFVNFHRVESRFGAADVIGGGDEDGDGDKKGGVEEVPGEVPQDVAGSSGQEYCCNEASKQCSVDAQYEHGQFEHAPSKSVQLCGVYPILTRNANVNGPMVCTESPAEINAFISALTSLEGTLMCETEDPSCQFGGL